MNRRDFAAALASAFLGVARLAVGQSRVPNIVCLWLGPAGSEGNALRGFQAGLREFGYEEGRNLTVDYRYAIGSEARLAELAAAAVAARPDLISTFGSIVTRAVAKLTPTIPIVSLSDPVGYGFAASLARPGGNITGMAVQVGPELAGKWLELLVEILPHARRIGFLRMEADRYSVAELGWIRTAAEHLANGLAIEDYAVPAAAELSSTFDAIKQAKPDGLVVDNDAFFASKRAETGAIGLPAISGSRDFADAGLLLSYGASIFDLVRRLASYIDRILKSAKPADLPIEQPTKFELVINLKTANSLGLTVPPILFAQADEVIE